MKDLSKIDFAKLKLPEWKNQECIARRSDEEIMVSWVRSVWNAKLTGGEWKFATCGSTFGELIELRNICSQVDAFIAAELAKLEPEWVDVKWTEVERLEKSGAKIQFLSNIGLGWLRRSSGDAGLSCYKYQVDLKTVPDGVNLYEPEWIDIPPCDVEALSLKGVRIHAKREHTDNEYQLIIINGGFGCVDGYKYKVDRRTCPPGYEPTKSAPTYIALNEVKQGEAVFLVASGKSVEIASIMTKQHMRLEDTPIYAAGTLEPGTWKLIAVKV